MWNFSLLEVVIPVIGGTGVTIKGTRHSVGKGEVSVFLPVFCVMLGKSL